MKEPTLKQAIHLLKLVDDSGITRNLLQDIFNKGLLSDLLRSDLSEIGRCEFRRVCRLPSIPDIGEFFKLPIDNAKKFKLIHLGEHRNLEDLISDISPTGYKIPIEESLDSFANQYPIADDDEQVGLAHSIGGFYGVLSGEYGKKWNKSFVSILSEIPPRKWLVEVVDEKSKQPEGTNEWREITLTRAITYFTCGPDSPGGKILPAGVFESGTKIVVSRKSSFLKFFKDQNQWFVPYFYLDHMYGFVLKNDVKNL
jgi:hypothetical protein